MKLSCVCYEERDRICTYNVHKTSKKDRAHIKFIKSSFQKKTFSPPFSIRNGIRTSTNIILYTQWYYSIWNGRGRGYILCPLESSRKKRGNKRSTSLSSQFHQTRLTSSLSKTGVRGSSVVSTPLFSFYEVPLLSLSLSLLL